MIKMVGRQQGIKNFTDAEITTLLDLIADVKPIGADHWSMVFQRFSAVHPSQRTEESLKKKFRSLANAKKPTGDPDCPAEVKRAKHLNQEIQEMIHMATLDDSDQEEEMEEDAEPTALPADPADPVDLPPPINHTQGALPSPAPMRHKKQHEGYHPYEVKITQMNMKKK
eukprot:GCRY01005308.1.p2 GENE.GCRY01005308.1~~GCRY01005308.1.p2  ORF type:complete len:169 (-),score=27.47 GCRY01005308.1:1524-2030(-)